MGEINQALGAAGTGAFFTWRNKRYQLSPLTKAAQASFEAWLEQRAWEASKRAKVSLSHKEYMELVGQVNADIAAGKYSFSTDLVADAMQTVPGVYWFCRTLLEPHHPDVTDDQITEMLSEVGDDLLAAVKRLLPGDDSKNSQEAKEQDNP